MIKYPVIDEQLFRETEALKYEAVDPNSISVVMPFFNNWHLTHQRLMELWKHVHIDEVVLVNDASTDDVDKAVAWWQKETPLPITYIKNEQNLGFGKSMNKGIWTASGEIVILLSNDVIVTGDFGIEVRKFIDLDTLIGNTLYDWDTGWNVFDMPDGKKMFPYLGGYFLAAYKDTFRELGGFDDRYGKFDYEDLDLSTRAVYMGYDLVPLNSPYLKHMSGQTVRKSFPDREKYTIENREKFYQKWKKIYYEDTSF